jgi:hypothetical protein
MQRGKDEPSPELLPHQDQESTGLNLKIILAKIAEGEIYGQDT